MFYDEQEASRLMPFQMRAYVLLGTPVGQDVNSLKQEGNDWVERFLGQSDVKNHSFLQAAS